MDVLPQKPVAQAIAERLVKPAMDKQAKATSGTIVAYYQSSNTADIDAYVRGMSMRYSNVQMPVSVGTIGRNPRPGDEVWISFLSNNHQHPQVVSFFDSTYQYATGLEQQTTAQALTPSYWGQN